VGIPWGLVAEVGLKIIAMLIREKERREKLQKQMLEFVKKFDSQIVSTGKLRHQYDELTKRADDDASKPS
jgi:hypothetical protein